MKEIETRFPQMYPDGVLNEIPGQPVHEIPGSSQDDAADVIPDEVPRRDGPGGE